MKEMEDVLESVMPKFGNEKKSTFAWDNSENRILIDEYESCNGHRYFCHMGITDGLLVVEHSAIFHNWTYIDRIKVYADNGKEIKLMKERKYEKTFWKEDFVRQERNAMTQDVIAELAESKQEIIPLATETLKMGKFVGGWYISPKGNKYNVRLINELTSKSSS